MKKTKRLLLLTSDGDKLKTPPHIRTIQTDRPLREPRIAKRSMECIAVMPLPEPHLFACDRMENLPLLTVVPMESQIIVKAM